MTRSFAAYFVGGAFVLTVTILAGSVSSKLLEQDKELTFKTPMREFIDILNKELEQSAYALRSTAELFRMSEMVSKYEFDNFISLVMNDSQNITAMAYFRLQKVYPRSFGEGELETIYWTRADETKNTTADIILPIALKHLTRKISAIPGDAVATNIFSVDDDDTYYSFVLQRVGLDGGFVGILVDVGYALEEILDNQIGQNYALYELDTVPSRKAFSSNDYVESQFNYIRNANFDDELFFFNRKWHVYSYQKTSVRKLLFYAAIPITGFLMSLLLVYFVWFGIRLKITNKEKEIAFAHLQFAQEKIVQAEKLTAMGGVVAGVAHEVNTPLGVSITSLSYLHEGLHDIRKDFEAGKLDVEGFQGFVESSDELIEMSLNNMRRASELVTRFKKIDVLNNGFTQEVEPVMVAALVEAFVERFYCEHPNSPVTFDIDIDKTKCVMTYPAALLEILSYLANNAVAHAFDEEQQNCEISIRYPLKNTQNVLQFKDNGRGLDKSMLHRLFDPFVTTKRGAGYAGLGLSVVYNLVKNKLHSDLSYGSEDGFSLSFEVKDIEE